MKTEKYFFWLSFWVGLISWLLYRIFWAFVYPKLGVEWNQYLVMAIFFLSGVLLAAYYGKKQQKKAEKTQ